MPWRAPLAALGGGFFGALLGAGIAWMGLPADRPLAIGDERLNVIRTSDGTLLKSVQADQAIDNVLQRLVEETPAIAYARVSVVHNGVMAMDNIHLLHFSTIASVAAPGWPAMAMPQNHPLAEVRDFVVPVFDHPTCTILQTATLSDKATAQRLQAAGVGVVIDCSIFSPRMQFLGMLYANFARPGDLPTNLEPIISRQRRTAIQIGRILVASR